MTLCSTYVYQIIDQPVSELTDKQTRNLRNKFKMFNKCINFTCMNSIYCP